MATIIQPKSQQSIIINNHALDCDKVNHSCTNTQQTHEFSNDIFIEQDTNGKMRVATIVRKTKEKEFIISGILSINSPIKSSQTNISDDHIGSIFEVGSVVTVDITEVQANKKIETQANQNTSFNTAIIRH